MEFYSGNSFYSYSYMPAPELEEQLIVSDCSGYICSKDFYYSRDTFHNYLVMHVTCGTLHVKQYGKSYALKENDSVLMDLNDAHTYYSDKEDTAHVLWFHFRGQPVDGIIQSLKKSKQLPIIFQSEKMKDTIFQCMHVCSEQQANFEIQLSALLYPAILEIAEPYLLKIYQQNLQEHSWFMDAIDSYINNRIYEKITLDDLCASVKMKKCYFCRKFKQILSMSPMQYVLLKKIEHSKSLLLGSDQNIDTIALALGFTDQSHFSKTFKKCVGTTPLKYRKGGENLKVNY